jgi:NHL repeat-containing protein
MAFQTYRVPPPTAGSPPFFEFVELSGVDPATGRTTMYLAVVALGTGCTPPAPPDQSIKLRVGAGAPATLLPGTPVHIDGATGPVGVATLSGSGVLLVEIEVLAVGSDWQIQLGSPTGGTLVVADTFAQTRQAWVDAPAELTFATTVGGSATRTLSVANRGTGPLTIDNPSGALGSGFTLTDVTPSTVIPNTCAVARVCFTAPPDPGQFTATLQVSGNDPNPSTVAGHNSKIQLTATVRRPLWEPGDLLVTDEGNDSTSGVIYRFHPTLGQTVLSAAGHLVAPSGMAFDPDGNLLVADSGPGDAPGWLLRIDRFTGVQTVLSSGGSFVTPTGVAVAPDGTIYVADFGSFDGPGSVFEVCPAGTQTVVSSGNLLGGPVDLLVRGSDILVLRSDDFGGAGAVIKVDAAGNQTVVSSKGLFVDPSMRPQALAIEPTGTLLVAETNGLSGGVLRINAASGGQQRLAALLGGRPLGIATTATGRIFVTSVASNATTPLLGIYELDPVSGQPTAVSAGGIFKIPRRLAIALPDPRTG